MGWTTTCTSSTCARASCSSARFQPGMLVRFQRSGRVRPTDRSSRPSRAGAPSRPYEQPTMNNPVQRHRVVIVGGGAGGLELATRLGDTLGKRGMADITLVDKH